MKTGVRLLLCVVAVALGACGGQDTLEVGVDSMKPGVQSGGLKVEFLANARAKNPSERSLTMAECVFDTMMEAYGEKTVRLYMQAIKPRDGGTAIPPGAEAAGVKAAAAVRTCARTQPGA